MVCVCCSGGGRGGGEGEEERGGGEGEVFSPALSSSTHKTSTILGKPHGRVTRIRIEEGARAMTANRVRGKKSNSRVRAKANNSQEAHQ